MTLLGTRVRRTEDPALLRGAGRYVGDLAPDDALHAVFVRSFLAHGSIESIDVSEALAMPGVVAVYTAADLELPAVPPPFPFFNADMTRTWLATDRVRYVGEPIALILAETPAAGADAAEAVFVDVEPLEAVVDPRAAATDELVVHEAAGTNTVFAQPCPDAEDFFAGCEVTATLSFRNQRMSGAPIEPRTSISSWGERDGRPHLTQWSCTQFPHTARDSIASACGVEQDDVRVITPEVGGGFGAKNGAYAEDIVVALAARAIGRPVAWVETRTESMLNLAHGRGQDFTATMGGTADGRITHYRLEILQDGGAYPATGSVLPMITGRMATGVYDIANLEVGFRSVITNTTPVGAYRGAGRPEAAHAIERMVDVFAAEVGADPAEVRRRNFVREDQFPYDTPAGMNMDTGRYEDALDAVLGVVDVDELRTEQARRRASGEPLLGLGWAAYVEVANPIGNGEFGSVEVRPDGSALVLTGSSAHGQGHHTTFAQVAADVLGIPFERIEVRHGDTGEVPRGGGTGGSRSLQTGGTAVHQAAELVVDRARELAAHLLEANVDDVVLDVDGGRFAVVGTPAVSVGWPEVATEAANGGEQLSGEIDFQPPGATFPFGVHASVVEVDPGTGEVTVVRHVACDDAGVLVNPMVVDGQVHGGVASGIAQALMEEFHYDPDGNPLTTNFLDYGIVSAAELPSFERIEQETPTPVNPLGVKGIGESGTIGSTPAVQNAVVDALAHLGVRHVDIPVTPQRVWRAMNEPGS
ncbi:MAG: xanthine dehydrogenase family protein molybdopterin-binding subunit [Actinomycetota bacterium]